MTDNGKTRRKGDRALSPFSGGKGDRTDAKGGQPCCPPSEKTSEKKGVDL